MRRILHYRKELRCFLKRKSEPRGEECRKAEKWRKRIISFTLGHGLDLILELERAIDLLEISIREKARGYAFPHFYLHGWRTKPAEAAE